MNVYLNKEKVDSIKTYLQMLGFSYQKLDYFNRDMCHNGERFLVKLLSWQLSTLKANPEYYIEQLLMDECKVYRKYMIEEYYYKKLNQPFSSDTEKADGKTIKFMESIAFINSELLNNSGEQMSIDIRLTLLELIGNMIKTISVNIDGSVCDIQDLFFVMHRLFGI